MGSINPSARLSTPEATRAGLGDLPSLPAISPGKPGAGGPGDAVDGRQGGSANLSGAGAALAAKSSSGPNLRQFLPGGKFDPKIRGPAGTAGPDGITGPHSNIWLKIQNRYQVVRPTLIP